MPMLSGNITFISRSFGGLGSSALTSLVSTIRAHDLNDGRAIRPQDKLRGG
jgi:hypothetical protein